MFGTGKEDGEVKVHRISSQGREITVCRPARHSQILADLPCVSEDSRVFTLYARAKAGGLQPCSASQRRPTAVQCMLTEPTRTPDRYWTFASDWKLSIFCQIMLNPSFGWHALAEKEKPRLAAQCDRAPATDIRLPRQCGRRFSICGRSASQSG